MKNVYKILIAITAMGLLSCGKEDKDDPSNFLKMDIGSSASILIPSPATTLSCEQIAKGDTASGAIAGSYFTLPNPVIEWTKSEAVPSEIRVVVLKFTLKSPGFGSEYTCTFSDLTLGSLFFKRDAIGENIAIRTWDGKLGRNSAAGVGVVSTRTMVESDTFDPCDIKCGGISLKKGVGLFSVTGTWELLAVQKKYESTTSNTYEEFPIKVQGSFTVDNVLN